MIVARGIGRNTTAGTHYGIVVTGGFGRHPVLSLSAFPFAGAVQVLAMYHGATPITVAYLGSTRVV